MNQSANQPEPSLREQWQHLVFRLLGGSDIAYTVSPVEVTKERKLIAEQFYPELMALYKAHKEAAEGVSILLKSDLAWCLGKLRGLGHPSEMLEARHALTHPQAGEGEGK